MTGVRKKAGDNSRLKIAIATGARATVVKMQDA
jgi:hypothetical protein